jgi:1-deoxy-D-xylulose-5-phosphate reductoisomerase
MKNIAILGSTGSIGRQALEVIESNPNRFSVEVLTAFNNVDLLIKQAKKFHPNVVVIANEDKYNEVSAALAYDGIKVYAGSAALNQVVEMGSIDMVLTAMVGYSGLIPTINAVKAGKPIALANKETLVVAGDLITRLARKNKVDIFPVDSEHSAIFQCLAGEHMNPVEKVIITCSGGPFNGMDQEQIASVTPKDALNHPCWSMGAKITIDSATLMNKGFEVIEAKWLFGLKPEQIEVVVHPQSIIHSMVQFGDGSIKAQLGLPDMRLPIQYAFSYPERLVNSYPRLNFTDFPSLTFSAPDTKIFRNIALAYEALQKGGNLACILNAANEIAVESFLRKKISFQNIWSVNEQLMQKASFIQQPTLEDYIASDLQSRAYARELVGTLQLQN